MITPFPIVYHDITEMDTDAKISETIHFKRAKPFINGKINTLQCFFSYKQ